MQMEKIHLDMSNEMSCVGSMDDDHRLKINKLTAVKVSMA